MSTSLLYFITSFLLVAAAIISFRKLTTVKAVALVVTTVLYTVFCFIAYGKMSGFIPTLTVEQIINQKGYDTSVLPLSVNTILNVGFMAATIFNLVTAVWILYRGSFWKWCLTVAGVFCISCAASGGAMGMSPLYALFGGCCGIMAATGWILGLSYIEFCVIGNIWVPGIALILAGGYLSIVSSKALVSRNTSAWKKVVAVFSFVAGAAEIFATLLILKHYIGTMNYAFYQCVEDLRYLASIAGTTYEAVNIYIYVFLFVGIVSFDIITGKWINSNKDRMRELS